MEFQELVESKKCPDCGAKNPSTAERCGVCGTDLKFIPASREMETLSSIRDSSFQGGVPPPPPPPGSQKPAAKPASAAGGFLKKAFWDFLLPVAAACAAVALFIAVGDKQAVAPAAGAQAMDKGPQALEAFMEYPLRYGDEKGKKMRQFWADYQKIYEMSRNAKAPGEQDAEIRFFQQPSGAAGVYKVFVAEKLPEAKPRVFPFSVNLETGEVSGLSRCDFGPGTEEEYLSSCADSRELFPDGV